MTKYNNNRFTPGNKGNLRLFMNKAFIKQYYQSFNSANDITEGTLCGCIPQQSNSIKQGLNDPSQSENTRISQALTRSLGGKITFGNSNKPVVINYLGGWEGQPNGLPRPLRNKF